ncbi:MAG: decaprenyl-phosphate phosphoribosyltransferase [Anaerolineales bacterium]|nr:decaprenyl-phosphate phosphoribosyltransferase [Anaerolineales bacterium]
MVSAILKTMRPKQWVKNIVIFAALIFDRQLTKVSSLLPTLAGFFLFCFITGVVYIINDLADLEADRKHPKKRFRPLAAGVLPVRVAQAVAIILLLLAFPLAYWLSREFAAVAAVYFLLNLAYSKWLKHIPLIDVLSIAAGFVLRVIAGVVLIEVERFSPWLYVVTTLGALYLGFGKRRAELALLAGDANAHRRVLNGYTLPFLDQLITIVSSTTIIAYSLYTFSAPNLPFNHTMMLTIPFVIYGIFRYLYLVQVEHKGGAPEDLAFTDHPLQLVILLWGLAVLIIFYLD